MSRSSPKTKPPDSAAKPPAPNPEPSASSNWWKYALAFAAALFVAFEVYGPALRGGFLFDDRYLPFLSPHAATMSLANWLNSPRPLLMLSFWLNYQLGVTEPYGYHALNVLLHACNAVFVFLITRRLLAASSPAANDSRHLIYAAFAGLLFLLHPLQTESVAYIASRSEALSVFFAYAGLTVFLYRRQLPASIGVAAAVLVLFVAAIATKEHAAVLPVLLLLTDYFFNPREGAFSFDGIKQNWKLYAPLSIGGVLGFASIGRMVLSADTAGFRMKDLTWSDYLLTQGRVLWTYLRLFVLPVGLNADYDFPISHSPLDKGAIFGLLAFAALLIGAWILRKRYPLAAFGILIFAVLIAPTSSIIPIRDPIAERRMYLPFLGLALVTVEILRQIKLQTGTLIASAGTLLAVCAYGTYARADVWSNPVSFWTDTAAKSPAKARPQSQLAFAHYETGRCDLAVQTYERTAKLQPLTYELALNWGVALDCANRTGEAIEKLDQAAGLERSAHPYAEKARVLLKLARWQEGYAALAIAESIDPKFEYIYLYRGSYFENRGDYASAATQFQKALALNPNNTMAREGLTRANYGIGARR